MDWMDLAHKMAANSLDPSTKVGAVLIGAYNTLAVGWNQFHPSVPESWWDDREKKYRAVIHAEQAAILNAGSMSRGAILVVTHHPCRECAKLIVASGISRVVCPSLPWRCDPAVEENVRDARELLQICGVEMVDYGTKN